MVTRMEKKHTINYYHVAYYSFLVLITMQSFLDYTMIEDSALRQPLRWLTFIMGTFVVIKIIAEWKNGWNAREAILGFIGPGMLLLCALYHPVSYVAPYALLVLGAKGLDGKKVLKTYLFLTIAMTLLTIGLCLTGQIEDVVTYRYEDSAHARRSLGFVYATCLTSHLLNIAMLWGYLRQKNITWMEIGLIFVMSIFCYWIAEARIASACIALEAVILVMFHIKKMRNIISKIMDVKWIKVCLIGIGCIIAGISILLAVIYQKDNSTWRTIADLSSGRINMNALAFERYTPRLFGQSISELGELANGQYSVQDYYFALNTSYIMILFKLGILGLASTLVIWMVISYREYHRKNYFSVLLFAIFSIFCFFEHRLLEFSNNPFLLLLFLTPEFEAKEDIEDKQHTYSENHPFAKVLLTSLALSILIEVVVFNWSSVISVTNDDISYADCQQYTENVVKTDYGTLQSTEELAEIYAINVPSYVGLDSIYIDINYFSCEDNYKQLTKPYQVDIYEVSYSSDEPLYCVEIDPKKPWTNYIPVNFSNLTQTFRFDFHFDDSVHFAINEFSFNTKIPFHIVFSRIVILFFLFLFGYLLYEKVRKSEKAKSN